MMMMHYSKYLWRTIQNSSGIKRLNIIVMYGCSRLNDSCLSGLFVKFTLSTHERRVGAGRASGRKMFIVVEGQLPKGSHFFVKAIHGNRWMWGNRPTHATM